MIEVIMIISKRISCDSMTTVTLWNVFPVSVIVTLVDVDPLSIWKSMP